MDPENKIQTRKRFIGLGLTAATLLTAFRFFIPSKKKKIETRKMLTQDGTLVEVDVTNMGCGIRKKISDDELKSWVKNK